MYRQCINVFTCNSVRVTCGYSEKACMISRPIIFTNDSRNRKYSICLNQPVKTKFVHCLNCSETCIQACETGLRLLAVNKFTLDVRPPARNLSLESIMRPVSESAVNFFTYLSNSSAVAHMKDGIITLHTVTGLPWWLTIVLTTGLLRTFVTFPLALYQHYILAKVENLKVELSDRIKEIKRKMPLDVRLNRWTEKQSNIEFHRAVKKEWTKLVVRDNCHPMKAGVLVWVQVPMWLVTSSAIRNIVFKLPQPTPEAEAICAELSHGGALWFSDLIMPDTTYILPVLFGLSNLIVIQIQTYQHSGRGTRFVQVFVTNIVRIVVLMMVPVAAQVPSCLCLYWITSSSYGIGQNLLLLSPKLRRFVGIPKTASEREKPYSHLMNEFTNHISKIPGLRPAKKKRRF